MKKKFLTVVVAGTLALSLVACGNDTKSSTESGATTESATTVEPKDTQVLTPPEPDTEAPAPTSESESTETNTKSAEDIILEVSQKDWTGKTMDMNMNMAMDMSVTMEGQTEAQKASINSTLSVKGNKDVMYISMKTDQAGGENSLNFDFDIWTDSINKATYMNYGGTWYKVDSSTAPDVNIDAFTKYNNDKVSDLEVKSAVHD